jgi:predicted DNA-binding protein (MmcQ/YjbR family)
MAAAKTKAKKSANAMIAEQLREWGLARYPGAHLKSPWPGHMDLAVKDKTFAYLSPDGEPLGISCKLPRSCALALSLPHTEPAGYGLGKSGWVAAKFPDDDTPPIDMLKEWIDESYRAQAPKKLIAQLDGAPPGGRGSTDAKARATTKKSATKKKSAPKRGTARS